MINRIQYQKRATCLSIVLLSLLFTSLVDAEVRVTRITDANVGELRREGPDAIGGVGDYFF